MKIILWRGYHDPKLKELLGEALQGKSLLILCPPHLKNYAFMNCLPSGELSFVGDWHKEDLTQAQLTSEKRTSSDYERLPHIGVFTSGTMSLSPSLVLFRKENVQHSLESILSLFKNEWAEKIICYPQPFHIFGLCLGYIHSILWKKKLHTPDGQYRKAFHDEWLKEERKGLLTLGAPVHFYDLLLKCNENLKMTRSSSVCGGARVSPELWKQFQEKLGIEFPSIGYGASEACPGLSHLAPGVAPQENGDIGKWLSGVEAKNHANGYEFSGPNMCLAIIETNANSQSTLRFPNSILIRDEIAQSGDRIIYKGRSDLKMNRGGEKFSLELIEEKIHSILKVPLIAVALADSRLGEKLGLCIQSNDNSKQLKEECKDLVAREFSWAMQDREINIMEQLPTNSNGKWDRKKAFECLN